MPDVVSVQLARPRCLVATIPNGQSFSDVIDIDSQIVGGILVPVSTAWTNANITFMVSVDEGATWADLFVDGSEYTITIATGRTRATYYAISSAVFGAFTHIKLRSGIGATPVNQGAERKIQIGRIP
jgi:hypothetical protein